MRRRPESSQDPTKPSHNHMRMGTYLDNFPLSVAAYLPGIGYAKTWGMARASRMQVNIFPFEHADEKRSHPG
jgi:hypothetical protein